MLGLRDVERRTYTIAYTFLWLTTAMRAGSKQNCGAPAEAFLTFALEYQLAATKLFEIREQVNAPLHILMAHAIELALKAYLRSREVDLAGKKHDLGRLLGECSEHGLKVGMDLRNVVEGLESENKHHGFRYFAFKPTVTPSVDYVRAELDKLMLAVKAEVEQRPSLDSGGIALKMTFGKPEAKR